MILHCILVQSSYTDERLSRRRLEITRETCLKSLAYQTQKPVVHLAVSNADPLRDERIAAFEATGCPVVVSVEPWKLYGMRFGLQPGFKIVSRMDDDDVLSHDFCELTQGCAAAAKPETALVWPVGYVVWRGAPYRLRHSGNQFVSLLSETSHPHERPHWRYVRTWRSAVVSQRAGWVWVRHGDAVSSTLEKYRTQKVSSIPNDVFPMNWRAVQRAIDPSGTPSANYREHNQLVRAKRAHSSL